MLLPLGADGEIERIALGNGTELTVQTTPYHRGLPHSYYDQAMESIKHLYPENDVLLGRRFGSLGEAVYSLVCYKQSKTSSNVMVTGMLVLDKMTWHFGGEVSAENFTDSLVLILEAISKLPQRSAVVHRLHRLQRGKQ